MGSNKNHKGHRATPGLGKALREMQRRAGAKARRKLARISRRLRRKAEFQKYILTCLD